MTGRHRGLWWFGAISFLFLTPTPSSSQAEEPPDTPRLRWEYFYEQRAYPFNEIPRGALQRARFQLGVRPMGVSAAPPPIQGTSWAPLGPQRIPSSGTSTGRLTAIAVHPTSSDIIYVGGAQGGVWKSTDGGMTWTPKTDEQCSLAMGSIAIDPVNPEIIYAGTGEQHFSSDSYYGCGVLRSEDGGETWTQLGASVFTGDDFTNAKISRVDVDPSTAGVVETTTVLAATTLGLFRSADGGAMWDLVLGGTATDLVRNPSDTQVLYAAIRSTGVFKSTDGGVTWVEIAEGFPTENVSRINLALAPSSPETILASIQHRSESNLLGIWKSTNGGASWIQLGANGASCGTQCWYNMTIAVSPADPNVVYFGGVSLYRSINGGLSFSDVRRGIHVDQHLITFDPQDPGTVYVGNDGGVFRSTDGGGSWTSLNTNLVLTQFYPGVSLHPWEAAVAMGGTQDNGTLESQGTDEYARVLGGDGGFTAINPQNPAIRYGETQWNTESTFSGPRRSDGGSFVRKVNGIDVTENALFIPPLVMDPVNPDRLYFGTVRLYRTDDRAESWTSISEPFNGRISAIAPAASDPMVVYMGTSTGGVHRTENGGELWSQITLGIPNRYIRDMAVDPTDWQKVFLTVSGFQSGHVFRSSDAGRTWEDISGDLPDIPVNAIVLDPAEANTLFIGTDLGVFVTNDGGVTWTAMKDGFPNVAVFDLAYNASTGVLLAATHGRGMFTLSLNRPLTLAVLPTGREGSELIGNPDTVPDSASVILTGVNSAGADWTATTETSWISLSTPTGSGTARLRWTRDLTGMGKGTYVGTIRVSADGAIDSPTEVVDTMVVLAPRQMTVDPGSRTHTFAVGSATPVQETASVGITGTNASLATWEATHGGSHWLTITTPSAQGSGMLEWTKDPTGLEEGVHVDTILVSSVGADGTPTSIVDSLIMNSPPVGLDPTVRGGNALAGSIELVHDSARVLIAGDGGDQWTAVSDSPWLTFTAGNGSGDGVLRWTRNPSGLTLGTYSGTITVESTNGGQAVLTDTFTLTAPAVQTECAADQLLGTPCLDDLQQRFLDLQGNGDGVYNLGDFLAQLVRDSAAKGSGGGP
ncbi:MAG: hypothetical protein HKO65_12900 [Gemmatimonadetes bacterium]|nr:hypothetical protein [Gemmatimonadota bacterium]NNM05980.1 hypothetical protein [Gemmatimonadota bacterium]